MKRIDHEIMVLDDDRSILGGLERLLTTHGYRVRLHSNADDFFSAGLPSVPSCLLLDHHLGEGMTGLQVHAEVIRRGWDLPTVFLTAHWDVKSVVRAMRAGADGFLTKPFDPEDLLDAIAAALQRARDNFAKGTLSDSAQAIADSLTAREREIVGMVVTGLLNKEIADKLGLALVTVKVHRGRAMRKMGAGNPADLARIAALIGIID